MPATAEGAAATTAGTLRPPTANNTERSTVTDPDFDRLSLHRDSPERVKRRARRELIIDLLDFADELLQSPKRLQLYDDSIEHLVLMLEAAADCIAEIDDPQP